MNHFENKLCGKTSLLLILCAASSTAHAQQQSNSHTTSSANNGEQSIEQNLETISVTGSRTDIDKRLVAGAITVIDDEQIRRSGAIHIADLLRTVPSVNISQSGPSGALTEIRFRGSESNHVLVMLDGVEINDLAQGGLIDLAHIALANISRIEILKGPQSALWGSNAVAGVISITSKSTSISATGSGATDKLHGNVGLSYGNRQSKRLTGSIANTHEKWRYSLNASHFTTKGENASRGGSESDGYTNTSVNSSLAYSFSDYHRVKANVRYVDYQSDFDAVDFSTGFLTDADNTSDGKQISFALDWHFSQKNSLWSQQLSYQFSQSENLNFNDASNAALRQLSGASEGQKQRLVYNHNFNFRQGHINLGLETVQEDFSQRGPVVFGDPNQDQDNDSTSFISDMQYSITQDWSLLASYRFDNNSSFENSESFRLGSRYILTDNFSAFTSYAKAIKNPTFTERFGFFPGTFLGNNNLVPEASKSFEIGMDADWDSYQLQLSWFRASLKNEILGFVFDQESALFTAQNSEFESDREGLEIALSAQYAKWHWAMNYAYLDANENEQAELRRAKHTASASINYQVSAEQSAYLQIDYTGTRDDVFFPPFPQESQRVSLSSYFLVSANYQYNYYENMQVSLRVSNALDTEYEDVFSFSGESRRVSVSLNYRW